MRAVELAEKMGCFFLLMGSQRCFKYGERCERYWTLITGPHQNTPLCMEIL